MPPDRSGLLREMDRERSLARLRDESFDLAIVGGGINGAAISRDAAIRGLRVALFDQGDPRRLALPAAGTVAPGLSGLARARTAAAVDGAASGPSDQVSFSLLSRT